MAWNDEYDYNRRLRKQPPKGVNRDTFNETGHPRKHTLKVGDLCYVILGQICNRYFNACRYQATGGLIINSPTYSKRLCQVIREDFTGLTREKHRQMLIDDFLNPDFEDRRNDAAIRLAHYYPKSWEQLVLQQLQKPTFNTFHCHDFVRSLYPVDDLNKRRKMLAAFLKKAGRIAKDGLLETLFEDLDLQIAAEEKRLSPPPAKPYQARRELQQLFGYKNVTLKDRPYRQQWSEVERARFVSSIGPTANKKVLVAVFSILTCSPDRF